MIQIRRRIKSTEAYLRVVYYQKPEAADIGSPLCFWDWCSVNSLGMRVWVKTSAGLPCMQTFWIKTCTFCGTRNRVTLLKSGFCSRCKRNLNFDWSKFRQDQRQHGTHPQRRSAQSLQFKCLNCKTDLRIPSPLRLNYEYACPECRTMFSFQQASVTPMVLLVIPSGGFSTGKVHPDKIKSALRAMHLNEAEDGSQVTSAYRELMKVYHPDKLIFMGEEVRKIAEEKSKTINTAYQELKTYFGLN